MKSARNSDSFYITTTIPYINADPHIGFALELVQSDAIARYQRLIGKDVFFSTGTDEYGQKIWEASVKEGKNIQDYIDYYAQKFLNLKKELNLSNDNFIRTTSDLHTRAAQEVWRLCDKNGDIYKKKYRGLYCVGCESFKSEKDLVDGKCPIHPTLTPEIVEEENYFFRLSKYRKNLLDYLQKEKSIIPEWRRKEAIDFVENAMDDFSVSRNKERLSWGISIPGDDSQVMYVWFGAFVNYLSTLGWPDDNEKLKKFWTDGYTVQTAGKDMVKFQSVMWQGMLMSAGISTTDTIVYHGFVTGEGGIRMSKSLGNVINPGEIVKEYGTDALRYFLLGEISSFEDSPFTMERFKEAYNAKLANGLGNLVSRIMKMAQDNLENPVVVKDIKFHKKFIERLDNYDLHKACEFIWMNIGLVDLAIQDEQPFKLIKIEPEKAKEKIKNLVQNLYFIALHLEIFLPETSKKMKELISSNKVPATPLFPRKD